jgi:hypothetical protein
MKKVFHITKQGKADLEKEWQNDHSVYDFDTRRFANGGEFYLPPQGDVSESELDQVDSN